CTFYYLLTGKVPFPGKTVMETLDMHRWLTPRRIREIRKQVPEDVEDLVRKLLAKRPEERFQTPAKLAAALEAIAQRGYASTPTSATRPLAKTTKALPVNAARKVIAGESSTKLEGESRQRASSLAELKKLKQQLADEIEKNEMANARGIISRMLRLNPNDSDALVPQTLLQGTEERIIAGHTDEVLCVAMAPASFQILSGSNDQTLRLWDAVSGKELRCLKGHTGPVRSVAFSPDGTS